MASQNPTRIEWPCATCGFPIEDGDGAISVPLPYPMQPRALDWAPLHDVCAPSIELYSVPVEQLRSAAGIARWTRHIYAKEWGHRTDWHNRVCGKVPMAGSGAGV